MSSTASPAVDWEWPYYTRTVHRGAYPSISPSNPALSAKDKVILITGGGSGVGRHIASAFVTAGAKTVVILGRREQKLQETKKDLENAAARDGTKTEVLSFAADVVDAGRLKEVFAEVKRRFGAVDVVVANAGSFPTPAETETADVETWWRGYEVNVKGTVLLWQAFMANRAAEGAVFVSVNTAMAHVGLVVPGSSAYLTSKAALASLIGALQTEAKDKGVRVVSMHPGVLETEMNAISGATMKMDDCEFLLVWLRGWLCLC